jgi:hypothetical protein
MKEDKVKEKKIHNICICGNPTYEPFCPQCGAVNKVLEEKIKEKVRS